MNNQSHIRCNATRKTKEGAAVLRQVNIYGNTKALYHEDKIRDLHLGRSISPTMIQVDLEASCNDNCSFCTTRKDNGLNNDMLKLLQINSVKKVSDYQPIGKPSDNSRLPLYMSQKLPQMMEDANIKAITLTGGGEPTLWPAFDDLIINLAKHDIDVGLITNGSNISDKRVDLLVNHCSWIRFSMDSSNSEIHKKVHRTPSLDFNKRIETLQKLLKKRTDQEVIIGISFVIMPDNFSDIENACNLYKNLGVDYLRFSWMYDKHGYAGLSNEQISKIKLKLEECQKKYSSNKFSAEYAENRINLYTKPNTDFEKCFYQRFVWAIGADGNVYPCCIQKYVPGFEMGNIKDHSLKDLVTNQFTVDKMNNLQPSSCAPCWMREKNKIIGLGVKRSNQIKKILSELNETKPVHINFV